MRGISFVTEMDTPLLMGCMFGNMNMSGFSWVLDEISPFFDPGFCESKYMGDEFRDFIMQDHHFNFMRLRQYLNGAEIGEIENYCEYIRSYCLLLLLCTDGGVYELYVKDAGALQTIKRILQSVGIDTEEITDDNDMRYTFTIA